MDKSIERIDQLVELWLDGSTTDAEEHELRSLVEACGEALPARLAWVATAFEGYGALAEERNPQPIKRPLRAQRQLIRPLQRVVQWGLAAAAVVAMAIAISIDREPYCYINGTAIHDAQLAMNETACFEHLAELDEAMSVLSMFENS
ncbi:MAG: hypothetical protein IJN01_06380 [Rikenellaceae bacterium]|nr:hypothetical protein [Rikenellaceae bacterium]